MRLALALAGASLSLLCAVTAARATYPYPNVQEMSYMALFGAGSTQLIGESQVKAAANAFLGKSCNGICKGEWPGQVFVMTHTDSVEASRNGMALSRARAESVKRMLVERGVPEDRIVTLAFTDQKPLAKNAPAETNRRVEIRFQVPRD